MEKQGDGKIKGEKANREYSIAMSFLSHI